MDQRKQAEELLKALREGERNECEGLPFYCERMMQQCSGQHRKDGRCACDQWDAKMGEQLLSGVLKAKS